MKILLLLLLPLITVPVIISHSSILNIYYNGTVEAELTGNVNQFVLIGHNITNLKIIGAKYNLSGNTLYLTPSNTTVFIYYNAILPRGVIQINEPYNATINIYLPLNSSINYISPQPYSFNVMSDYYNVTFANVNSVILLYTLSSHVTTTQNELEIPMIIGGLISSDAVLVSLIIFLLRRGNVRVLKEEESVDFVPEVLDERDTIVLEAIKMGTNTLADIVRQTGLPKSTAYRRVKKLVKLGYIEEIREEGKIRYVVRSDKK
ncbi:helix-turn-helix domain-containing protein [Sulfolobus islandicus]|uniref:Transcriptional regulator, TrmB n=1 Tax=Saccharolobus islandicus (strain HVE10/4) TaxID=930943 RepID=F0NL54_SACI0|nr:helix-turn-helix domain-containing protein [Sulfolobus islandicus]ADX83545.1 transcriptional regulator, TrmB [Sulfolobus islandicus HVE10/4]WCM37715.1 helix-turn-helix domain-containing protein [Sulfolobus islandicus]